MVGIFGKFPGTSPDRKITEHTIGSYAPLSTTSTGDPFVESKKIADQMISEIRGLHSEFPDGIPPEQLDQIKNGITDCVKADTPHKERQNRELIRGKIGSAILVKAQNSGGFPEKAAIQPHLLALELVTDATDAQLSRALYFLYATTYLKGARVPKGDEMVTDNLDLSYNGKFDPLTTLDNIYAIWSAYNHKKSLQRVPTQKFGAYQAASPSGKTPLSQKSTRKKPSPELLDSCMEVVERFLLEKDNNQAHKDSILQRGVLVTKSRTELRKLHDELVEAFKDSAMDPAILAVMRSQTEMREGSQTTEIASIFESDVTPEKSEDDTNHPFFSNLTTSLDAYFSNRAQLAMLKRSIEQFSHKEGGPEEPLERLSEQTIEKLGDLIHAKELLETLGPLQQEATRLLEMETPPLERIRRLGSRIQVLTDKWAHKIESKKKSPLEPKKELKPKSEEEQSGEKPPRPSPKKTLLKIMRGLHGLDEVVTKLQGLPKDVVKPSKFGVFPIKELPKK